MPEFHMIFARKINPIPEFPNFTWYMPEKINKVPEFYTIFARRIFFPIFFFWGGRRQAAPVSYAYAKDLANIFRTLPGPGEFQELAPPLYTNAGLISKVYEETASKMMKIIAWLMESTDGFYISSFCQLLWKFFCCFGLYDSVALRQCCKLMSFCI